ncbi:hypothetical protein AGDE_12599 [Angomonas deanei]|uniref:Fusaric acid resistance protein-like n=1 Tax=Angomonas deanei TaxID=59799 RepID=A0A7G2C8J9_9TRYP|nr:hypothetical protein AGDE_12599 [Angomonas deanei]CAD2215083.1 hypothetical protein, conserved [Angomonas deanei]|eukprot:EPY23961.1 hypothetical protein AGDE_12599 [Angomonas deanei]
MEFVNVGALLLDGVTTPNSSESDHSDNDSFYLKEPAEKKNSGFYFVNHDPPPLRTYVPLHVDTTPLKAYITSLFYPEVYMKVFYAARLTFMVALPLSLLARIPRMMKIFPFHVVIPLFGIVDSRYRTGEQIAGCIMSCQAALFFLVYGTLLNVWNTLDHPSAWWCSVIFGVFVVSLFGDVRSKRYLCLFTALIVGMQHSPGGTRIINPALCARDVVMASGFALLQVFVPPRTNAREADDIMRGVWQHIIRIMKSATVACWSEDPIECTLALSNMATEPIQNALAEMPMKLNFVMYEPWVTTLQLQLRRERVELLQNFRPVYTP